MTQTFKGFLYMVAGKLATFTDKAKRWMTYDSIVLSQEQLVTINGICGKTGIVQYMSILQDPKSKVIGFCVEGMTKEGQVFVTDNIPIDVNGDILTKRADNETLH